MRLKAVKLMVEYEDGSVDLASGKIAEDIWAYLEDCQVFKHVHGFHYSGPHFIHLVPEVKDDGK
jgi:hypothetical protein